MLIAAGKIKLQLIEVGTFWGTQFII